MNQDSKPLIVQRDRTLLLEVNHPKYEKVRELLVPFAERVKSPECIHTYRITPLSLWNAAALGMKADEIIHILRENSKVTLPLSIQSEVQEWMGRYGKLRLEPWGNDLALVSDDANLLTQVSRFPEVVKRIKKVESNRFLLKQEDRGFLKQALVQEGYPVEDQAGYTTGEELRLQLRKRSRSGIPFQLREYQEQAIEAFYRNGSASGGNGVILLPCGAGKTIVGLAVLARLEKETLILTPNATSVRQWIDEILDKTDLSREQVGEYTGTRKEVKPVTVATYQILTHRGRQKSFTHLNLFHRRDWGLIIYDEVHLLPAPVFRATADLQARRRLGLTATLVREDGREKDVFSLIGPKIMEAPWKELEDRGWIATARCTEIRASMAEERYREYRTAGRRQKYRIAAENPDKLMVLERIIRHHAPEPVLIIGQYLNQLGHIASHLSAPLITGSTSHQRREQLYQLFRQGQIPVLIVSKVANFAVDLPDVRVAVQVSGTFGSRQEEAQRLGRILRPKKTDNQAFFYQIVTRDTLDQEYAQNRQLFLIEQGYHYHVMDAEQWEV
nr:DNA repair helicase XPB [Kroppenstedtia pulmonis]